MKLKTACALAIAACVLNILLILVNFIQYSTIGVGFEYYMGAIVNIVSHVLFCVFFVTLYNKLNNSK